MIGKARTFTVNGNAYEVWSDFIKRSTEAKDIQTGEVRKIHGNGYIVNDLTVRRAIALAFQLPTFRKERTK